MTTTLTCQACLRPLGQDQSFCENCGTRAADRPAPPPVPPPSRPDRIPLPRQVQMREILTPNRARTVERRGKHTGAWVFLFVVLLVAGLTVVVLRLAGASGPGTEAERQAAALARAQAELRPQLDRFMLSRAAFFAGERRYLPTVTRVRAALTEYNRQLVAVENEIDAINAAHAGRCGDSCASLDYPAYPARPALTQELRDLAAVERRMDELHTELVTMHVSGGMIIAYSDLLSAVDLMGQDAEQNLDALNDMLGPQDEDYGGGLGALDVADLRGNSALPAILRMNADLLRLLERVQLPVGTLDLPGGRDRFRADHSTSL
ncbi:hypothetical protein KIH74_10800 [Kineosporia sp. J2-2]|uniref:Zinc ribbon domain-containing protein n=1 Tax=Kineosporia corallincola TaxID=2835133 RepID=A0ABS5TEA8_9ACTN|nr:hypothetical protein [Kineosporia corallincola]MBT0769410.1 hypothetical protein [Kineosporia corallincola]